MNPVSSTDFGGALGTGCLRSMCFSKYAGAMKNLLHFGHYMGLVPCTPAFTISAVSGCLNMNS